MTNHFSDLPLRPELQKNLIELKFHTMTPIQQRGLPIVLKGENILAQAKTGSGKTATFALGILNSLDISYLRPQSLILCPTRELAEQVAKEARTLGRFIKNVRVLTVCGGMAQIHQENSLAHGAHILVGTPGRVLRLLQQRLLNVDNIRTFVLDEADKMLDMGFNEDIMAIESYLPTQRQTMLFSATYPDEIKELSEKIQSAATKIKVDTTHSAEVIDQLFYKVEKHQDKNAALLTILAEYRPERLIIFCKTKRITDDVANFLNKFGIQAAAIHGDLEQNERTTVLAMFSNRSLSVLVATDVAARGLDVRELEAVINYDLPTDPEVYVHRIGRTGRAGKNGQVYNLIVPRDHFFLGAIEELTHQICHVADISTLNPGKKYDLSPPMRTMYVGGGKKNKLRPGDILGALTGEANIPSDAIGDISILNIISFVAIRPEYIDSAIVKLRNGRIKNKKFKVGLS